MSIRTSRAREDREKSSGELSLHHWHKYATEDVHYIERFTLHESRDEADQPGAALTDIGIAGWNRLRPGLPGSTRLYCVHFIIGQHDVNLFLLNYSSLNLSEE